MFSSMQMIHDKGQGAARLGTKKLIASGVHCPYPQPALEHSGEGMQRRSSTGPRAHRNVEEDEEGGAKHGQDDGSSAHACVQRGEEEGGWISCCS